MTRRSVKATRLACSPQQVAGLFYVANQGSTGHLTVADDPGSAVRETDRAWRLDHGWLQDWLLGCPDASSTPYLGLRRLLPGGVLELEPRAPVRVSNTIGPEVWAEADLAGQDAEEAFREAFDRAVGDLADGAPVLTSELSGGLDSTYMVATLARTARSPVYSFVAVPERSAVLPPTPRVVSDEPAARQLADCYPAAVCLRAVQTPESESPLEVARRISSRSWWPALGVSNLGWVEQIRECAAELGSPHVWTGSNGNAAFSYSHGYADRSLRTRVERLRPRNRDRPSLLSTLLNHPPSAAPRMDRRRYLEWLAGQLHPHAAFGNPAAFARPSVDPYRAPEVLEVAARIKPEAWRRPGMTRGFARTLGQGRVPDAIRLRQARGAQGLDVWQQMYRHRVQYETQVELLADTPAIADLVNRSAVRSLVQTWSWDRRLPPPQIQTSVVNRLLAFGQFIRDAETRLRRQTDGFSGPFEGSG